MCQGLGPKTHDEISEIDRSSSSSIRHVEVPLTVSRPTYRGKQYIIYIKWKHYLIHISQKFIYFRFP